jgi:cation diffusion facilitator CzcD-associated flavoprotein CzcO
MSEHLDVVVVGAGLSGIAAGYHLQTRCPDKRFAILEARDAIGGTWDLFRYPGIRSDSDMFTLGYSFKPWPRRESIADGATILEYVRETADEHGIVDHIRFGHRVTHASWSTADARWTLTGDGFELTCDFLFVCSGYYDYEQPYAPEFPGAERFRGELVHPQHWPEDLDYAGKRVVVIGSGATAVTLVPALAQRAEQVTMLQRSPSYVFALPAHDPLAAGLRRTLPRRLAYKAIRLKNVLLTSYFFNLSRRRPEQVKKFVRRAAATQLPPGYDLDTHFKPSYNPWDQRMCLVPDGDLFRAIRRGTAEVVTDHIETFTEDGIRLRSGRELEADVVISATGLTMLSFGGATVDIDGRDVEPAETIAYKGMMLSDVPNFAFAIGYTNASWTLKCELAAKYVCRLLNHMDRRDYAIAVPEVGDDSVDALPFMDFTSGYIQRALHLLPKQGSKRPWRLHQSYPRDLVTLARGSVEESMRFVKRSSRPSRPDGPPARGGRFARSRPRSDAERAAPARTR